MNKAILKIALVWVSSLWLSDAEHVVNDDVPSQRGAVTVIAWLIEAEGNEFWTFIVNLTIRT